MRLMSATLVAAAVGGMSLVSATSASAYSGWGGGDLRVVSYINGDAGKNADVDPNSSCSNPDRYDMQAFSTDATNPGNNNVHNDACFLDDRGGKVGKDIGASFRSSGTGSISACPDPDRVVTNGVVVSNGPAISRLRDLDGDGRNDSCFQSSYQETGKAGDREYHARVNNTGTAGGQQVSWGRDRDGDGRIDDRDQDRVVVDWSKDGLTGGTRSSTW